ncbi:hypothetical protein P7K49_034619 [Saguinus oedipus]|uniref:Uncharacterized protein n=1 Tax=Saguinus oedipus TaxID=9490 RepID=A0ABQ9TV85_SAGOE|nr:hypothetical protein P7K49_034619 [Saguinus oedipus]
MTGWSLHPVQAVAHAPPAHAWALTNAARYISLGYAGFPHSLLSSLPFRVLVPKPAGN